MKRKGLLLVTITAMLLFNMISVLSIVTANSIPTIDGVLSSGEWDTYYLGTSITGWSGGMQVMVYGFSDGTFLYAAYKVDIPNSPGFATALILGIPPNLYYKTPQTASWPDPGYTIIEMTYPWLMQTDGSGWAVVYPDLASMQGAGIEIGIDTNWWSHNGEAEFKIPLSILAYAGDDGQILLNGQYWQYDFATSFFVNLPSASALSLKTDAIESLEVINSLNDEGQKKLDEALYYLRESVNGEPGDNELLWIDDNHLYPDNGDDVFSLENDAVEKLMEILEKPDEYGASTTVVGGIVDIIVDQILKSDEVLAQTAIDEAVALGGDPSEADQEMDNAQIAILDEEYDKAVEYYFKAWEAALKSVGII